MSKIVPKIFSEKTKKNNFTEEKVSLGSKSPEESSDIKKSSSEKESKEPEEGNESEQEERRVPKPYQNNPRPTYPFNARRAGWEGTVVLAVLVDTNGLPSQIEIKNSSGYSILDSAARETVLRWRFEPATRAGRSLAARVSIPIHFRLNETMNK